MVRAETSKNPVGAALAGFFVRSVITYTAPAAKTVVTAVATIATTTSEGLNPNANSASASASAVPVAPLPVSLMAFAAQASGPDVRLSWATASEINNAFEVARSPDGATFAPVARYIAQSGQGQALMLPATLANGSYVGQV